MKILQTTTSLNNSYQRNKSNEIVSFKSNLAKLTENSKVFKPINDVYQKGEEQIARGIGKILDTKSAYRLLEKTKNIKGLFNHLMTAGSVVLSSLYIIKTLTNKNLDEQKRNTLAINQGIVFGISTALCYAVENKMNSKIALFGNKFEAVKVGKIADERLKKCVKGVGVAGKIIIFDTIYRFIAPVFVTPLANHIGNKVNENKEAKLAAAQKQTNS